MCWQKRTLCHNYWYIQVNYLIFQDQKVVIYVNGYLPLTSPTLTVTLDPATAFDPDTILAQALILLFVYTQTLYLLKYFTLVTQYRQRLSHLQRVLGISPNAGHIMSAVRVGMPSFKHA